MNTKTIKLDINKRLYEKITAKQGDTKSRFLLFHLLDGASPFSLVNRTVRVYGLKPDKKEIFNDLKIVDANKGHCELELTNQALAIIGDLDLELAIYEGESKLTSIPFTVDVLKSINSTNAIESSNEYKALDRSLTKVEEWNNEFADKSGKLEQLYTERLNGIDSHLEDMAIQKRYEKNAMLPLNITTYEKSGQATHPSVIYFENRWNGYRYWMANTPYPYHNDDYENPCILTSSDGVNWSTPKGLVNPIDEPTSEQISTKYHMSDCELVFANGKLECWYRLNVNGGLDQILRKTSSDGITWSEREVVLDKSTCGFYCLSPSLIYEDGKYKMWYVGTQYQIYYIESVSGANGTWSSPVIVARNYTTSPVTSDMQPWHMDVIKDFDGKYKFVFCTILDKNLQRSIYLGESQDGLTINNLHKILTPSINGWDNLELYRPTLVPITRNQYKMYYGGVSKDDVWKIGVIEGENLELLNNIGFTFDNKGALNIPAIKLGEISSMNDEEILLARKGEKAVKVKNTNNGELSILNENETDGATLKVKNSTTSKNTTALTESTHIKTDTVRPLNSTGIQQYGVVTLLGIDGTGKPVYKFLNSGVNDGCITLGDANHTLRIAKANDLSPSFLEVSALIFGQSNLNIGNVEGAIRYNFTTKKHQGYNGTTWNDLY